MLNKIENRPSLRSKSRNK